MQRLKKKKLMRKLLMLNFQQFKKIKMMRLVLVVMD